MKLNITGKNSSPFSASSESLERLGEAIGQAAEHGQAMVEKGLKNWEAEVERYYEDLSAHSRETLEALGKCKAPSDVLGVEREWLKARAQAYLDSGKRFAEAFADVARTIPGDYVAAKAAIEAHVHKS